MTTYSVTIRHKGQMTLPAEIRSELGISEGTRLLAQRRGKEIILISSKDIIDNTAGALAEYAKNAAPMTSAEMRKTAADAIAEENLETLQQIERDHARR